MGIAGIFRSPADRLRRAIAEAGKPRADRERCIADLRAAIARDAQAAAEAGSADVVIEAYRLFAGLCVQAGQGDQAMAALGELRRYDAGQPAAIELALELAHDPAAGEQTLLMAADCLAEAGRLQELAADLRTALDDRFPRSAALAARLGDALVAAKEFDEAARRFRAAVDLRPDEAARFMPALEALVAAGGESTLVHETLGLIFFRQRDYTQAAMHLSAAAAQGALQVRPLFDLADALLELHQLDEAANALEQLLAKSANEVELIRRCERLVDRDAARGTWAYRRTQRVWGDALRRQSRFEEALARYRLALDDLPPDREGQAFAASLVERLVDIVPRVGAGASADANLELGRAHGLAGAPERALEAYNAAIKADRSALPRATGGLAALASLAGSPLPLRLRLAELQTEAGDDRAAFDTLEALRREQPAERAGLVHGYQSLLAALEALAPDAALAAGPHAGVLAGTLHALAEERAAQPADAIACLARALALGPGQAEPVLSQLARLGLLAQPVLGPLTEGDAQQAKHDVDAALAAYGRVPVSIQTVDALCERLERLAQVDTARPDALVAAATARLATGSLAAGIALLQRAFARRKDAVAPLIAGRLAALREADSCPADGLALLVDALAQLGNAPSLAEGLAVARTLLEASPERAEQVAAQASALQEKHDAKSKGYAQAALLKGDALAIAGRHGDAALAYAGAVGHAQADRRQVVARLQELTAKAPEAAVAWMVLGDAYRLQAKPAAEEALASYERALRAEAGQGAADVLERLGAVKVKSKSDMALRLCLLRAEALARLHDPAAAAAELAGALGDYRARACDEIVRVLHLLPDAPVAWFLQADVEATRGQPEQAAAWLDRAVARGSDGDAQSAEAALERLAAQFTASAAPRLSRARALKRLGRHDEAAHLLGDTAAAFPPARAEALAMLDELSQAAPSTATWLSRARAFIADDNVPAAMDALARAQQDRAVLPAVYECLQEIAARHPARPDVLRALVEVETLLHSEEAAGQAVVHAQAWLAAAPAEAAAIAAALAQVLDLLQVLELAASPLAREARLAWADALLAAQQPELAAQQLSAALAAWPEAAPHVVERCRRALATVAAPSLRVVWADAHIACGEFDLAIDVCREAPADDATAGQALAERCQAVLAATQAEQPAVAARAARALAELQARRGDALGAAQACRTAAALDATLVEPLAHWLAGQGWDAESHRILLYAGADILRDAGEATLDPALAAYRGILDLDLVAEAPQVLLALERFPREYLPAWQMRLDTCLRLGPAHDAAALEAMRGILDGFGPEQAGALLAASRRMDPGEPASYLARAMVHEAAGSLEEAAADLLELQAALPAELPRVEHGFRDLIARHADQHALRLALGDAYRQAEKWDEALAAYAEAQQAAAQLASALIERYADAVAHVPASVPARWGLAQAHVALGQPGPAAQCADELTDIDAGQTERVAAFLQDLLHAHRACGYGWYVRGKLAYRSGEYRPAIKHFERALKEGEVPPRPLALLYDMMGRAAQACGDLDQALVNLRQAATLAPDDPALRDALMAVRLALLDRAIAAKEASVATSAEPLQARLELAELLQQRGAYARATAVLQAALPQAERASTVHLALARCFGGQRLHHLAAASLEAALASGELDIEGRKEALCRLAEARRRQLRYDEAIAALEQVCALDATYQNVLGLIDIVQREKVAAQSRPAELRPTSDVSLLTRGR